MPVTDSSRAGFSLLEVVIAAALLLLTVTAVTACVTAVSSAGRRSDAALEADRAMAAVAAWLGGLPFCPAELPAPSAAEGAEASDLCSAVFPRAHAGGDTDDGRYVPVDESGIAAGSFVTTLESGGIAVECVARFHDANGAWLEPLDLDGFDVATSRRVPAAFLVLDLRAGMPGASRSCRLEAHAGDRADVDAGEGAP